MTQDTGQPAKGLFKFIRPSLTYLLVNLRGVKVYIYLNREFKSYLDYFLGTHVQYFLSRCILRRPKLHTTYGIDNMYVIHQSLMGQKQHIAWMPPPPSQRLYIIITSTFHFNSQPTNKHIVTESLALRIHMNNISF